LSLVSSPSLGFPPPAFFRVFCFSFSLFFSFSSLFCQSHLYLSGRHLLAPIPRFIASFVSDWCTPETFLTLFFFLLSLFYYRLYSRFPVSLEHLCQSIISIGLYPTSILLPFPYSLPSPYVLFGTFQNKYPACGDARASPPLH